MKLLAKGTNILDTRHIELLYSYRDTLVKTKDGALVVTRCILWLNLNSGALAHKKENRMFLKSIPLQEMDYIFDTLLTTTNSEVNSDLISTLVALGTDFVDPRETSPGVCQAFRSGVVGTCVQKLKQATTNIGANAVVIKNALRLAQALYDNNERTVFKVWPFKSVNTVKTLAHMFPDIPESAGIFPSAVGVSETLEGAREFVTENAEFFAEFDEMEMPLLSTEQETVVAESFNMLLKENETFAAALSDLYAAFTDKNLERFIESVLRPRDEAKIFGETNNPECSLAFWMATLPLAESGTTCSQGNNAEKFAVRILQTLKDTLAKETARNKELIEHFASYGGLTHLIYYTQVSIESDKEGTMTSLCLEALNTIFMHRLYDNCITGTSVDGLMSSVLNGYTRMPNTACTAATLVIKAIKDSPLASTLGVPCIELIRRTIEELCEILIGLQPPDPERYINGISALCWEEYTTNFVLNRLFPVIEKAPPRRQILPLVKLANVVLEAWENVAVPVQILRGALDILRKTEDEDVLAEYLSLFNNIIKHTTEDCNLQDYLNEDDLAKFVFWECLFSNAKRRKKGEERKGEGTPESRSSSSASVRAQHRCTTERSSRLALDVLYNIVRKNENALYPVFVQITEHYNCFADCFSGANKNFDFGSLGRDKKHMYCGLNNINLKVCFANVILQMLYMVPKFRTFVLKNEAPETVTAGAAGAAVATEKGEDTEKSTEKKTFKLLRDLFYQMRYSNLKYCEPYKLYKTVWGNDILNQEDACEFLEKLVSQVEGTFKDNEALKFVVPDMFTGKSVQTITCSIGHKKVIKEDFLTLK